MVSAALEFRQAMPVIAGNSADAPARKIRQQADCNFMGANDPEWKRVCRAESVMKILQERFFKPGKVNNKRTGIPMMAAADGAGGLNQFVPDDIRRHRRRQGFGGNAGDALHRPRDDRLGRQSNQVSLRRGIRRLGRRRSTGMQPADFKQMSFLGVGAGCLAVKGQDF